MHRINEFSKLNDNEFVREAVECTANKIVNNDNNVLLTGSKGSGKTTTAYYLKEKGLYSDNKYIMMNLDKMNIFIKDEDNELIESYYELVFAFELLYYIKKYYPMIFSESFKDEYEFVSNERKNLIHYYNDKFYGDLEVPKYYKTKELSEKILDKMYLNFMPSKFNLLIDYFDSVCDGNEYVQKLLAKYFDLFEQTIIVSSDDNIKSKDFDIYRLPPYSKEMIKEIFIRRFKTYEILNAQSLPIDLYDLIYNDYFIDMMINKTSGNIKQMLNIFNEILNTLTYDFFVAVNNTELENIIDKQVEHDYLLKTLSKKPKLYI